MTHLINGHHEIEISKHDYSEVFYMTNREREIFNSANKIILHLYTTGNNIEIQAEMISHGNNPSK